jgi:CO dehydrogenase/acetyl-CoA synthase beta subunit
MNYLSQEINKLNLGECGKAFLNKLNNHFKQRGAAEEEFEEEEEESEEEDDEAKESPGLKASSSSQK